MKKRFFVSVFLFLTLAISPTFANTITIYDAVGDAIGTDFETYKMVVKNYTPGVNSGSITFDIYTDYPKEGITAGSWKTIPADLFITETYHGVNYEWAIPLVDHDSFTAGTMYAVGSFFTSDHFDPGGGYIYNHGEKAQIATIGSNYGYTSFGGGTVNWASSNGISDWIITITTGGVWQDDPNGIFRMSWGTGTCDNDVIKGSTVPEPATLMMLGIGLIGVAGVSRKRLK